MYLTGTPCSQHYPECGQVLSISTDGPENLLAAIHRLPLILRSTLPAVSESVFHSIELFTDTSAGIFSILSGIQTSVMKMLYSHRANAIAVIRQSFQQLNVEFDAEVCLFIFLKMAASQSISQGDLNISIFASFPPSRRRLNMDMIFSYSIGVRQFPYPQRPHLTVSPHLQVDSAAQSWVASWPEHTATEKVVLSK